MHAADISYELLMAHCFLFILVGFWTPAYDLAVYLCNVEVV